MKDFRLLCVGLRKYLVKFLFETFEFRRLLPSEKSRAHNFHDQEVQKFVHTPWCDNMGWWWNPSLLYVLQCISFFVLFGCLCSPIKTIPLSGNQKFLLLSTIKQTMEQSQITKNTISMYTRLQDNMIPKQFIMEFLCSKDSELAFPRRFFPRVGSQPIMAFVKAIGGKFAATPDARRQWELLIQDEVGESARPLINPPNCLPHSIRTRHVHEIRSNCNGLFLVEEIPLANKTVIGKFWWEIFGDFF